MKSPAFSFYVRDWLCSKTVSKLHSKPASKGIGAYLYLLASAWLEEPRATLPDDETELANLARVSTEEFKEIWPMISDQFPVLSAGRRYNERLLAESNKQDQRKVAGSKGGSKTHSKPRANRVADHANEIENENGTNTNSSTVEHLTEDQAVDSTMTVGIPEAFTRYVYQDWNSRSGKDAGGVDVAFLPYVTKRWVREQGEWRSGHHKGAKSIKASAPLAAPSKPHVLNLTEFTFRLGDKKLVFSPERGPTEKDIPNNPSLLLTAQYAYEDWLALRNKQGAPK